MAESDDHNSLVQRAVSCRVVRTIAAEPVEMGGSRGAQERDQRKFEEDVLKNDKPVQLTLGRMVQPMQADSFQPGDDRRGAR